MGISERLLSNSGPIAPGPVRVVYTDMDGTMLGRGGSFFHGPDGAATLEPAQTLLDALAAGIDVVPTSGRALRGLLNDARILGLSTLIAEMGTLLAYDVGGELVHIFGDTPTEDGELPAQTMTRTGALDVLFEAYPERLEFHTPWSRWRECTHLLRGLVDTGEVNALLADRGFGWVEIQDNGMLAREVLGIPQGTAHVYHLMPRGISKASAVALDRKRRGLSKEECIAIGDARADICLASEVSTLVLIRDAVERDEMVAKEGLALDNVMVSDRDLNLGWVDAMRAVLATGAS